jgi:hypothetical protein
MQYHFKYVSFKNFLVVYINFNLDNVYPLNFLIEHLGTCSLKEIAP